MLRNPRLPTDCLVIYHVIISQAGMILISSLNPVTCVFHIHFYSEKRAMQYLPPCFVLIDNFISDRVVDSLENLQYLVIKRFAY